VFVIQNALRTAAVCLALATAGQVWAQPPTAAPLWQLKPFDRVTLTNNATHDIDPWRIPPGVEFDVEEGEYVGRPGLPPKREVHRRRRYRIRLQVNGLEYYVLGRNIKNIEYYEDLLLAEAKRLVTQARFDEALPYFERLHEIAPDWPGLDEAVVEAQRQEAARSFFAEDWERAFWLFVEALRRRDERSVVDAVSPPLENEIDRTADRWLAGRAAARDYAEMRRIVARLETVRPQSPVAARWRSELAARAAEALQTGLRLASDGKPIDALAPLEQAAAIDPSDAAVRGALEEAYGRRGHLRVAVEQLAGLRSPAARSAADRRCVDLVHLRLMAPVFGADPPRWKSEVLSSVTRPDEFVNRRAVLELRPGLVWSTGDKPVSAVDIQRILVDACRAESESFHPAFARLASQIETQSTQELSIDFDRPQPRPEAWLDMPVARRAGGDGSKWIGLGPFAVARADRERVEYRANPHFSQPGKPLLGKVTEMRIPAAADRLRALQENRVDIVANLLPRQVPAARSLADAGVVELAGPVVYVLQFNWNQRALRDRTLRRAVALAVDRRAILEKLGVDPGDAGALPTAPWPVGGFGYDPSIEPRPYDPVLARTLVAAVRRKQSSLPALRLLHDDVQADRLACEEIARGLTSAGLEVQLVASNPTAPASPSTADLYYAGLRVAEPVQDMVALLTRDNPSLWDHASPWLRQAVVNLVEVPTITDARQLMARLHRAIHDDAALLPIWQGPEWIAVSNRVRGLPERPTAVYDGVLDVAVTPGFEPPYWNVASKLGEAD
jgi:ABC-type transport system substrate-binding protein